MTLRLRYFPTCPSCGNSTLSLMPKVRREDPDRLYCTSCREQCWPAEVVYVER